MLIRQMPLPSAARPQVRNAPVFIDNLLQPEVAAANSNFMHYANANQASTAWTRCTTGG
jgi:spermidine/putrescine-binding protein